jgi:rhomboid protease GluP
MLKRQKTGSILCPSCGKLVGINDEECFYCGRKKPGMWGFAQMFRRFGTNLGFVPFVLYGCAALYIAMLLLDPRGISMEGMNILSPSSTMLFAFGDSGAFPVFVYGRWWTVLSAAWLHGSLLHIVFNLLWIRQLAPETAELFGASRNVIIYTIASISGFLLSSFAGFFFGNIPILGGAAFTLGASAPIFGLLGALVAYGNRTGSHSIGGQAKYYAIILFVMGIIMPGVDNFAHLGGFAGGYLAALCMDPLVRERFSHMMAAVICIGLTIASILASLLTSGIFIRRG